MIHLEVAVTAPLQSTLSYLPPQDSTIRECSDGAELIGFRVLVPLGRRVVTGYVLGCSPEQEVEYKLKRIAKIGGDQPLFSPEMVVFFRWVSEYYQHPIGEVVSTALPAGLKSQSQKTIRLVNRMDTAIRDELPERKTPHWLEELVIKKKLTGQQTKRILANPVEAKELDKLIDRGIAAIKEEVTGSSIRAKHETCYIAAQRLDVPELEVLDDDALKLLQKDFSTKFSYKFKVAETKVLYHCHNIARKTKAPVPRKDLLKLYKGAGKPLQELCSRGVLQQENKRVYRNPWGEVPAYLSRPDRLSLEQEAAYREIQAALDKKVFTPFLLHGVTGSGKTEVYLRAAEHCLKLGGDVLVLVPEIALATQLEAHFVSRFGRQVALLHSGLSRGEKFDQWSLAATGKVNIIIGARSAVFAPLKKIGLIIVDEEHDGGLKQHDGLKYNGRDMAVLRAKLLDCPVILGSATPAVTSYHHAKTGKYKLLTIKNRIGEGGMPEVKIVDLGKKVKNNSKSLFADVFLDELAVNLQNNEQSLVLINRRGFSSSYLCQECGTAVQCKHCNVTLTYHKNRSSLICHYCGYSVGSKLICENCRSDKLIPFGVGTERVEEELSSFFPDAVIQRLDSDSAYDRKKFLSILKSMREREIDILIGTQMIAKGHHFPHVSFVGVVWADGGLNMPDFRASERTYQLLSQVTGRAGRESTKGRVIIQTMLPNHYAVELAKNHDYEAFFAKEIAMRRKPAFPPYRRLACYRVSGEIEYNVRKTACNIAAACRKLKSSKNINLDVLGPAPSPLEKIKDRYRWQILLKAEHTTTLHSVGRYIAENSRNLVAGQTRVALDLDPENMM